MSSRCAYVGIAVLLVLGGCAQWAGAPPRDLTMLALPPMASDTVVLDVHFVRVPSAQSALVDGFWEEVDEQALDIGLRRRLASNGFRCGLVGQVLPTRLQHVLDRVESATGSDGTAVVPPVDEVAVRSQRMHSRAGHPGKIVLRSDVIENLAALLRDEQGNIQGRSLRKAQLYLQVKTEPQGSGAVALELTPIIEHGEPRTAYAVQQGVWALDNTRRATERYDALSVRALLTPGQSLVVTGTVDDRGLGGQFFGADLDTGQAALILLIRLQQTQLDGRFEAEATSEPIATYSD